MPEEPPAHSGSRWEPSADDQGETTRPLRSSQPPADPAPADPVATEPGAAEPLAADPAASRRHRLGRPVATVAAAGVLAATGVGGFAIGRATGEDHSPAPTSVIRDGGTDQHWGDHGGRGFRDGQGDPDGGSLPGGNASDGPAAGT